MKYLDKSDALIERKPKTVIIEKEIDRIIKKHGRITPELMIEEARDEKSALHNAFEWNDSKAAEKYRIAQARAMVIATRFVCMLNTDGTLKKAQAMHAIKNAGKHYLRKFLPSGDSDGGFKPRVEVLSSEDGRALFIERKINVLRSWCESVIDVPELQELRDKVLSAIPA